METDRTVASDNSGSAVAAAGDDTAGSGGSTLDAVKDIGVAGIDAGVDLYYTLRRAGGVAAEGLTSAAVDMVEHKHGSDAGRAARQVGDSVTNLGHAAFNAYTVHGAGTLTTNTSRPPRAKHAILSDAEQACSAAFDMIMCLHIIQVP